MQPQHFVLYVRRGKRPIGCGVGGPRYRHLFESAQGPAVPRGEADLGRTTLVRNGRHGNPPAVAARTDDMVGRHTYSVEEDLVEFRVTVDLHDRPDRDPRRAHIHQQRGNALVSWRFRLRAYQQQAPVGPGRVARPDLLTVDDPVVVFEPATGRE